MDSRSCSCWRLGGRNTPVHAVVRQLWARNGCQALSFEARLPSVYSARCRAVPYCHRFSILARKNPEAAAKFHHDLEEHIERRQVGAIRACSWQTV